MVLTFCDITSVLKVQEERARANQFSALGLLAGGIGHDFNQILMTIVGNLGMARKLMQRGLGRRGTGRGGARLPARPRADLAALDILEGL